MLQRRQSSTQPLSRLSHLGQARSGLKEEEIKVVEEEVKVVEEEVKVVEEEVKVVEEEVKKAEAEVEESQTPTRPCRMCDVFTGL